LQKNETIHLADSAKTFATNLEPIVDNRTSGVRRKFSWGASFSGMWWSLVFGVCCL